LNNLFIYWSLVRCLDECAHTTPRTCGARTP